jgi:chromosomal replication initiator protein
MISAYLIPGIIRSIDEIVADSFQVSLPDMGSKSRNRELVVARHFAMWFRYLNTKDGPSRIGSLYNRDHATVIYACKAINNLIDTDKAFRKKVEFTLQRLEEAGHGKNK